MTIQTINAGLWFPYPMDDLATTTYGTMTLNANNAKAAFVFDAPKTGNIDRIGFMTGTVTAGDTMDIRLETVDANGDPSGTLVSTNSNGSQVIASTDDNVWFETTLTAVGAVTQGDRIAAVIAAPSTATFNGDIRKYPGTGPSINYPYSDFYNGTSWTKSSSKPVCSLRYDDTNYYPVHGGHVASALTSSAYNTGSNPDEQGNKITVPWPCRATGWWVHSSQGGDANVSLYQGTTLLSSGVMDKDYSGGGANNRLCLGYFAAPQSLAANTAYYLSLLPTTATNVAIKYQTVPSAAAMGGLPGGTNVIGATRVDAGAWSDQTTRRYYIGLLLDGFADDLGGGLVVTPLALGVAMLLLIFAKSAAVAGGGGTATGARRAKKRRVS